MHSALGPTQTFLESKDAVFAPQKVQAWSLDEGLSRLYRCECELDLDHAQSAEVQGWLGVRVVLRTRRAHQVRVVHGLISRIEVCDVGHARRAVRLQIMPALSALEQHVHSRIYAERSLGELMRALLGGPGTEEWKSSAAKHTSLAHGTTQQDQDAFERCLIDIVPTPKLALLQYQESVWSFIERTLAAWGLTFFFRHDPLAPCEQLIIVSDTRNLAATQTCASGPGSATSSPTPMHYEVIASSQQLRAKEGIFSLRWMREPEAKVVLHAHYVAEDAAVFHESTTPKTPSNPSASKAHQNDGSYSAALSGKHTLSALAAPGRFVGNYAAERFASTEASRPKEIEEDGQQQSPYESCQLYLERQGVVHSWRQALRAHSECGGTGNVLGLCAGQIIEVKNPATNAFEAILITSASHSASELEDGAFEQSFGFVPALIPFAAPNRSAPKPGLQMARVIGPENDDVHVDGAGRVLVRLSFEQSDQHHQSHGVWADLTQAWAGSQFGAFFFPRIGSQVVVDLLDEGPGAPVMPVVMGSTYNEVQSPPSGTASGRYLSGFRTRSTPNAKGSRFNELLFDDSYGTERLELRAQHSMRSWVGNDAEMRIGAAHDPIHWGLKLALVALEELSAFEYSVLQRSIAQGDRAVYEAETLGRTSQPSLTDGPLAPVTMRGLKSLRGQLTLLRELLAKLVARGQGLGADLKKRSFVRRDYLRVCDLLSDFATSQLFGLSAETRTILLEASRLMRVVLAFLLQPDATYESSVSGSHTHKVTGPTTETLIGGRHTTLGNKNLFGVLRHGLAKGILARLRQTLGMPPSEWRLSDAFEKPHTPLEKKDVFGDSAQFVAGHQSIRVGSKNKPSAVHLAARAHGQRTQHIKRNDRLFVGQKALWTLRRLTLQVIEAMRLVVGGKLSFEVDDDMHVQTKQKLQLTAQEALRMTSKTNLFASAERYARIDGRLVTLTGKHAVKLEQGGASITIKDGNISIVGRKISLHGLTDIDIRSIKTNIR